MMIEEEDDDDDDDGDIRIIWVETVWEKVETTELTYLSNILQITV
jgi:hypothetical protein